MLNFWIKLYEFWKNKSKINEKDIITSNMLIDYRNIQAKINNIIYRQPK